MADQVPPNVVDLLKDLVGAVVMQQAQIAELQNDRTNLVEASEKLAAAVGALQSHADSVSGETGLTSQLGDLSAVPGLHEQLTAALPVPAEAPAQTAAAAPVEGAQQAA